jgi:hypothetical protein
VDRESVLRVARYSARSPVVESRLRYDAEGAEVELVPDARASPECPTLPGKGHLDD